MIDYDFSLYFIDFLCVVNLLSKYALMLLGQIIINIRCTYRIYIVYMYCTCTSTIILSKTYGRFSNYFY